MKKYFNAYFPFLVYFLCMIALYFMCFFIFPKYTELIALIGVFVIYAYIYFGIPILGFIMGRVVMKRASNVPITTCITYSLVTLCLMILVSSMKYIFMDCMYFRFPFSFSIFIEHLTHNDSMYVSIGSFLSFSVGEIVEYRKK